MIIDNKITWKDHVSYIAGKVSRGIGMVIKAKQYLQKEALVTLYYSFIYSYLLQSYPGGNVCLKFE